MDCGRRVKHVAPELSFWLKFDTPGLGWCWCSSFAIASLNFVFSVFLRDSKCWYSQLKSKQCSGGEPFSVLHLKVLSNIAWMDFYPMQFLPLEFCISARWWAKQDMDVLPVVQQLKTSLQPCRRWKFPSGMAEIHFPLRYQQVVCVCSAHFTGDCLLNETLHAAGFSIFSSSVFGSSLKTSTLVNTVSFCYSAKGIQYICAQGKLQISSHVWGKKLTFILLKNINTVLLLWNTFFWNLNCATAGF